LKNETLDIEKTGNDERCFNQLDTVVMQPNLLFPGEALEKDIVYTPEWVVVDMIEHFKPSGKILDSCKGDGAFLKHLPKDTEWCEIREGIDFFAYHAKVDWIIGNPPYSNYAKWIYHSMTIADKFAYIFPTQKPFCSYTMFKKVRVWGGIKHIRIYGTGTSIGWTFGYAVGAIYWEKGWRGGLEFSYYE